jgi:hypothetical protein
MSGATPLMSEVTSQMYEMTLSDVRTRHVYATPRSASSARFTLPLIVLMTSSSAAGSAV